MKKLYYIIAQVEFVFLVWVHLIGSPSEEFTFIVLASGLSLLAGGMTFED